MQFQNAFKLEKQKCLAKVKDKFRGSNVVSSKVVKVVKTRLLEK